MCSHYNDNKLTLLWCYSDYESMLHSLWAHATMIRSSWYRDYESMLWWLWSHTTMIMSMYCVNATVIMSSYYSIYELMLQWLLAGTTMIMRSFHCDYDPVLLHIAILVPKKQVWLWFQNKTLLPCGHGISINLIMCKCEMGSKPSYVSYAWLCG